MTDTASTGTNGAASGDSGVTVEGARASVELNGAVVLRPTSSRGTRRRRTAAANGTTAGESELEERVGALHSAVVAELARRRDTAGLEPADSVPVPVKQLSSITRDIPRVGRAAPLLAASAAGATRSLLSAQTLSRALTFIAEQRRLAERQVEDDDALDEFGFDREWTEALLPLFRWLYTDYWRVKVVGLEHVPSRGRALLVSNHAGVLPFDGAMIRTALFDEHPAHRHARALIMDAFFGMPMLSWFLRRTGNTLANPHDAQRLLERDELVLVFPEGVKGTGKPYSRRYRLGRFGRGGFASVALRTQSPVIPVSVVGSEELYPMLANVTPVARLLGLPYFPLTPTFPWLGPLGVVPLPSSWIIEFHEPIRPRGGPDAADDPSRVMEVSDQVREVVQAGLYRNLARRGSVFA